MLSSVLREKIFNVRQLSHAARHKTHGHAFGLRVKAMLLAQCKLFYVKEFLITDYSKAFYNVYWENSHIFRGILY
jgi:hypothetical protein